MDNKQRKEIEQKFLNAMQPRYRTKQIALMKAMSDEVLLDHYEDAKQLAKVYRDNPQIRHLPPQEVMRLPIQKMEIYKKIDGKAEMVESKFIVAFPA